MTYDQECREFVRVLTTTPLGTGQSLRQMTDYGGICLWWFADFDLIDLLLSIPADQPEDFYPKELGFQRQLCRLPRWVFGLLNTGFDLSRKGVLGMVRGIYEKAQLKPDQLRRPLVLFNSEDLYWRRQHDYAAGTFVSTDVFFQPLLNYAKTQGQPSFLGTYPYVKYPYPLSEFTKATKILIDRYKNGQLAYRSFNQYWNFGIGAEEFRGGRLFRGRWKRLENDPVLRRLCAFKGVDRFELIRDQLRFYFYILFGYIVKRLALCERLLGAVRPDLVLLVNEYGHFERALLITAKRKGIPTAAIQHGNITASHQGYIYDKNDIAPDGGTADCRCPIPDKTMVFGPHFKRLLAEESAYPEESLVVTGNPVYDVLGQIRQRCTREAILGAYGVDPAKTAILWTTQSHGLSDRENQANINAVQNAAQQLPECVFVIKQHPNEGPNYTRLYQAAAETTANIVWVPPKSNILELIFACDIMMAKFSTTIMEAMALDKDIVILNLGGDKDKGDYVQQQLAAGVYRGEDLTPTIRKIINHTLDLTDQRRAYIKEYLYAIDGQATERIFTIIQTMLETRRS